MKNLLNILAIYFQDQYLQNENLNEHFGIAEFVAAVHESCCCMEEQPQYTRPDRQPSHSHHLPSVASLGHLVAIFSELLEKRKANIHAKMEEVGQAVARVKELENHVAGLKNTHATLENSLSEANDNIQNMTTTLQQSVFFQMIFSFDYLYSLGLVLCISLFQLFLFLSSSSGATILCSSITTPSLQLTFCLHPICVF
ncbi:hypothetical protein E2C01_088384 [Portunus trituberculatus]|uniref:Uncharacterized protein n=1 Tax=Portunus trituberculatus TaxID=210409 RepID=A0A5B7J934_PORTR|nr:hypothetical protein [Portunus trituberculatus]